MNIERDKFLTEAMGLCWHELDTHYTRPHCLKCGKNEFDNPNFNLENYKYNFSTWEGFGILYEWMRVVGSMPEFTNTNRMINLINPDKFANAVYNFLKEV